MASIYQGMSVEELDAEIQKLQADVDALKAKNFQLDMARGKPSPAQADVSKPMLDTVDSTHDLIDEGVDAGNYGAPDGLPGARKLMAEVIGVDPANVTVCGSSSLNLMFDAVTHAWNYGVLGNEPMVKQAEKQPLKFLCPAPGYDRHFKVTEFVGFENVAIPMLEDGPDMDMVEQLVNNDPTVKGIWCVPKYENPIGLTFSDEVVRRFAALKPAAPDFRIYWDNAYVIHEISDHPDELLEIFGAVAEAGNDNLVYEFASTSKVCFPGSGIACIAASPADMADLRKMFAIQRVCGDKMTQLEYVRYFKNLDGLKAHMQKHIAFLAPRFELVEKKLSEGLGEVGCATWSKPHGGYFVSFDGPEGSAKRTVALAAELGVKLTPAGATWPGGIDPHDTNIRIAPTYPELDELSDALDVLVACSKLVSAQLERESR